MRLPVSILSRLTCSVLSLSSCGRPLKMGLQILQPLSPDVTFLTLLLQWSLWWEIACGEYLNTFLFSLHAAAIVWPACRGQNKFRSLNWVSSHCRVHARVPLFLMLCFAGDKVCCDQKWQECTGKSNIIHPKLFFYVVCETCDSFLMYRHVLCVFGAEILWTFGPSCCVVVALTGAYPYQCSTSWMRPV